MLYCRIRLAQCHIKGFECTEEAKKMTWKCVTSYQKHKWRMASKNSETPAKYGSGMKTTDWKIVESSTN